MTKNIIILISLFLSIAQIFPATDLLVFSPRSSHYTFTLNNKVYLIGGNYGGNRDSVYSHNDIWASSDCRAWDRLSKDFLTPHRTEFSLAVFNNRIWIIGGYYLENEQYLSDIWYSEDCVNWTQAVYRSSFSGRMKAGAVVHKDKLYLIGGIGEGGKLLTDVWSSTNGIDWIQISHENPFPNERTNKVFSLGDNIVLFSEKHGVFISADGKEWSNASQNDLVINRRDFSIIKKDDVLYLTGGELLFEDQSYTEYANDIWTSEDGINWTKKGPRPIINGADPTFYMLTPARSGHSTVLFKDKMYIIGGFNRYTEDKYFNDVWVSKKGEMWFKIR